MEWLNYHHLLYFWSVARLGSVAAAAAELRLAPTTVSGQLRRLEHVLGASLFDRRGRRLVLTETGRLAFDYATQIFSLGREFLDAVEGQPSVRPQKLVVGVAQVLPPSLVRRFLEPAFRLGRAMTVECRADKPVAEFVADLALHRVDLVIADGPARDNVRARTVSRLLGECGTSFFATRRLARSLGPRFPRSLHGAPLLVPGERSAFRRALEQWCDARRLHPHLVGVFDDSALAKDFGEAGQGVFTAPSVIEKEVLDRYKVTLVGRRRDLRQQFFAISIERRHEHPAVAAICAGAHADTFKVRPSPPG